MASTTTNGSGVKAAATETENELAAVLRELRGDLSSLRADMEALKSDGAGLGRAAVNTAKDAAENAVTEVRARTQHTVKTVEEDLADVAHDIAATVQRNPYTTIGVAVLGGMLLTNLFSKKD